MSIFDAKVQEQYSNIETKDSFVPLAAKQPRKKAFVPIASLPCRYDIKGQTISIFQKPEHLKIDASIEEQADSELDTVEKVNTHGPFQNLETNHSFEG